MRYYTSLNMVYSCPLESGGERFMSIDTFRLKEEFSLERNLFPSRLKDNKRSKQKTITFTLKQL